MRDSSWKKKESHVAIIASESRSLEGRSPHQCRLRESEPQPNGRATLCARSMSPGATQRG